MNFGRTLKELRTSHNITQKELAQDLHYSQSIISDWEKGNKEPTANAIITLAKYFKIPTDYILGIEADDQYSQEIDQSSDEQLLLRAYRQMSEGKKRALFQMLDIDENAINHTKKTS